MFQYLTALEIIYGFGIAFAKCSIVHLYFTTGSLPAQQFRTAIYGLAFILIPCGLSDVFVAIFQCSPIRFAWDKSVQGSRIDQTAFYRWTSFPNIITVVSMLSLPMPMVWNCMPPWPRRLVYPRCSQWGACKCGYENVGEARADT